MIKKCVLAIALVTQPLGLACREPQVTTADDHIVQCRQIRARLSARRGVDLAARRREGLRGAEAFRVGLIKRGHDVLLAEKIVRFQQTAETNRLLADRPGLGGFDGLTAEKITRAIRGTAGKPIEGDAAFGKFTGRWFGLWDKTEVDHSWDAIDDDPPSIGQGDWPDPSSLQFAWVGEAFCWHGVFALPGEPETWVILGTVYHVRDDQIDAPVPHVAVAVSGGRLAWITPSHVFFEEVLPGERYVITGFVYDMNQGKLTLRNRQGFQAVYTRSPSDRPPFLMFQIDLEN